MTDEVLDLEIVEAKAPDLVCLEDYDAAVRLMILLANRGPSPRPGAEKVDATHPVGKQWLSHACEHVYRKLDQSFRDGPKVTTEQQARAFVKALAPHFLDASKALLEAAETLKAAGKVMPANRAYVAHKRAAAKAQELNP